MPLRTSALALALTLGIAACARTHGPPPPEQPAAVLRVENDGFADMDVFVLRESGARVRLGFVTGSSAADLRIPPSVLSGTGVLRFLARPVGGNGPSVSQAISVSPGDTVVMTIPH